MQSQCSMCLNVLVYNLKLLSYVWNTQPQRTEINHKKLFRRTCSFISIPGVGVWLVVLLCILVSQLFSWCDGKPMTVFGCSQQILFQCHLFLYVKHTCIVPLRRLSNIFQTKPLSLIHISLECRFWYAQVIGCFSDWLAIFNQCDRLFHQRRITVSIFLTFSFPIARHSEKWRTSTTVT